MKIVRIGALVVAVAAVAAFAGVGLPEGAKGLNDQSGRGITVNGTGKITTIPDRAGFWFGVEDRNKTASDASAANARDMQKLLDALRKAGVLDKNIQTADVSVSPIYSKDGSDVIGYVASSSVSVTVGLDIAGSVVQAAEDAGADQVSGPTFTKADTDALYRDALRAAVADARSRAEVLADAAGVKVGAVISIEESSAPGPIAYDTIGAKADSISIEPGTQDVEATVTVTFAIA